MKIISGHSVDRDDFVAQVPTYMGKHSLRLFAIGFLEMAEISAERAVANACSIDAVIPATLFSLRHSVELFLKYVIYDLAVVDESVAIKGHRLSDILAKHGTSIATALETEPQSGFRRDEWMACLQEVIAAVHELDPDGQSVRYPADNALSPNQGGGYAISTKHLAQSIARTSLMYRSYEQRNC